MLYIQFSEREGNPWVICWQPNIFQVGAIFDVFHQSSCIRICYLIMSFMNLITISLCTVSLLVRHLLCYALYGYIECITITVAHIKYVILYLLIICNIFYFWPVFSMNHRLSLWWTMNSCSLPLSSYSTLQGGHDGDRWEI